VRSTLDAFFYPVASQGNLSVRLSVDYAAAFKTRSLMQTPFLSPDLLPGKKNSHYF